MHAVLRSFLLAAAVLVAGPAWSGSLATARPAADDGGNALFGTLLAPASGAVSRPADRPGQPKRVDRVEVALIAGVEQAAPGEPFRIGLKIRHDPYWHTYWRVPGDSGLPTRFEPVGPAGTTFADIAWPAPNRYAIGPYANYGYGDDVVLSRLATLPADFVGDRARFEVKAEWLVCRDVCIPGEVDLALELPVAAESRTGAAMAPFEVSLATVPDPDRSMPARWSQNGREAVLELPAGVEAGRAEFFPYFEGQIRPVAPQRLMAAGTGARQLHLERVENAPDELPDPMAGLLVADGRSIEVTLVAASGPLPAPSAPIAVAEARAAPPDSAGAFGSTLAAGMPSAGGSSASTLSLAAALAGAFVGGLLLNLMPCVFPVIGLKLLGFARAGHGDPALARRHALAFAAGVVISFTALGLGLAVLRLFGERLGWGFQLQSPLFVAAMALLFVAIALNLFGVFETGLAASRMAPEIRSNGLGGSFGTGVIAVLVATPCTAPFMGGAIGYTLAAPTGVMVLVFVSLGIGMALPYLLLAGNGRLARRLPKPGPWLLTFRQFLAFPMLATAAWLAWVLTLQVGADGLLRLLVAAVLVGLLAWIIGRRQSGAANGTGTRHAWLAIALAALVAGVTLLVEIHRLTPEAATSQPTAAAAAAPGEAVRWEPWSVERVAEARAAGQPVFVDFTAAWCISCQANKKLALERAAVEQAFRARNVRLLRADWTRRDAAIGAELARFGRNGVPLYLFYRAGGGEPVLLPELLTPSIVLSALGAS